MLDSSVSNSLSPEAMEKTFLMVKVSRDPGSLADPISQPDGVQRGLVGEILRRLEKKGLQLQACKLLQVRPAVGQEEGATGQATKEQLALHYSSLAGQRSLPSLLEHLASGPILATVWTGSSDPHGSKTWHFAGFGAVSVCQQLLGSSDPSPRSPGTIRGDLALQVSGWHILKYIFYRSEPLTYLHTKQAFYLRQ